MVIVIITVFHLIEQSTCVPRLLGATEVNYVCAHSIDISGILEVQLTPESYITLFMNQNNDFKNILKVGFDVYLFIKYF